MSDFLEHYQGPFKAVLRWHQLDDLWQTVRERAGEGWYIYPIEEEIPRKTASEGDLGAFIEETDQKLRDLHDEKYCGIVYTDDFTAPTLIKIYHPKNLGASCGSSGETILPAWILSTLPPADLLDWVAEKEKKPAWWKRMVRGVR